MSHFFTSGGQSIGASASASVLLMNIQGLFPLGLTGLTCLQSKGLSIVLSSTKVQKHQVFSAQPSLCRDSFVGPCWSLPVLDPAVASASAHHPPTLFFLPASGFPIRALTTVHTPFCRRQRGLFTDKAGSPFFPHIFIYLHFWLCWVFIAACGFSLVAVHRLVCFLLQWLLLLQSVGSRAQAQ